MTCREKLMIDHPKYVSDDYIGGCEACPHTFGYLDPPEYCRGFENVVTCTDRQCRECWNREI